MPLEVRRSLKVQGPCLLVFGLQRALVELSFRLLTHNNTPVKLAKWHSKRWCRFKMPLGMR